MMYLFIVIMWACVMGVAFYVERKAQQAHEQVFPINRTEKRKWN